MEASEFIDYYEILEISPNANSGTIDRMFRYLAQRHHPDNPETGDRVRFAVRPRACNVASRELWLISSQIRRGQAKVPAANRQTGRLSCGGPILPSEATHTGEPPKYWP